MQTKPPEAQPAAIPLFAPRAGPSVALDGVWRIAAAHEGEGLEAGYADPELDDAGWEGVRLPHLRHSTVEQDTLWYRHRFSAGSIPDDWLRAAGGRIVLRFGGAFYRSRVWVNGSELGGHEGYFQPFGFDVTDLIGPGDNVVAIRCRFPVEAGEFKRKTAVAGIFTDWDCKPYPSALYPNLPAPTEWTVPLGLWQPACLEFNGPILIESLNVFARLDSLRWPSRPDEAGADEAHLQVVADLRNLTPRPRSLRATVEVAPHNFAGGVLARGEALASLGAYERRQVHLRLSLPRPRLWFPWTHGEPWLYEARLRVQAAGGGADGRPPHEAAQAFGLREVRADIGPDRWEWRLNGRRIFPKGSNYISDFYLDRVSLDGLRRDVELARGANLDLLRVHAHIAPPDFYRLCDEQGLLVMCDFPLIWTYAYDLPPNEEAAFRQSVGRQVEDMVRLLGSRPSIILWSMHNEPPWTPDGSFLGGDVHRAETNRDLDEASAARVRQLDPTRPAIPASGVLDQHLYHGWYTGRWQDNGQLRPSFPTEFGVQALPNLHSPFWATVNTHWPVDADDASWAHAGFQSVFWASPGVGGPSQYASLADYVSESQAYQAFFIRYAIDQWRRRKFDPVGGYIHFLFTDGWPAITWSVLDYFRLPKAGYRALAEASRPVHVCIELEPGYGVERGFHLVYGRGGELRLRLHLVNDDYRLGGRVLIRWWVQRRGLLSRLGLGRWLAGRWLLANLPAADAAAQPIAEVCHSLKRPGQYTFRVQALRGRRVVADNRLDFRVGTPRPERRSARRVPSLLIGQVYQAGSLRHTRDGFAFGLRNPAMPVVLQRLSALRVDGRPVDASQVEIVSGGASRPASRITPQAAMEIPSGEGFTIVVRDYPLAAGMHELELTAHFVGLGEISAQFRDQLV